MAAAADDETKVEPEEPTPDGGEEKVVEEEETEESPFYKTPLATRMLITRQRPGRHIGRGGRNHRFNQFVDRARRILRMNESMTVHGIESGMATACALVEVLKREKVAEIESVQTNVNLRARFPDNNGFFSSAYISMDFVLRRGENASYITDIKQRRLIAIFEKYDTEHTGFLPKATVEGLDMGEAFYSTEAQKADAATFLKSMAGDKVSMPDFIKYASALIDDNLRSRVFNQRANEKYGVALPPPRP